MIFLIFYFKNAVILLQNISVFIYICVNIYICVFMFLDFPLCLSMLCKTHIWKYLEKFALTICMPF